MSCMWVLMKREKKEPIRVGEDPKRGWALILTSDDRWVGRDGDGDGVETKARSKPVGGIRMKGRPSKARRQQQSKVIR